MRLPGALFEVGRSLRQESQAGVDATEEEVRLRGIGGEDDGAFEMGTGFGEAIQLKKNPAEFELGARQLAGLLEGGLEERHGFQGAALAGEGDGVVDAGVFAAGVVVDGLSIEGFGVAPAAEGVVAESFDAIAAAVSVETGQDCKRFREAIHEI